MSNKIIKLQDFSWTLEKINSRYFFGVWIHKRIWRSHKFMMLEISVRLEISKFVLSHIHMVLFLLYYSFQTKYKDSLKSYKF